MTDAARLEALVRGFRGRRVLVLADLVADEFVYGRVERISREAPVLILRHDATRRAAGRRRERRPQHPDPRRPAAAVRRRRQGRPRPELRALLREKRIDATGVLDEPGYATPGQVAHPRRPRALHEAADRAPRPLRPPRRRAARRAARWSARCARSAGGSTASS